MTVTTLDRTDSPARVDYDVIVVGAGFAGLYALHRLRDREGLRVKALEAADDVGGTWYWNRYPGARCDIESFHYSYSFSPELEQEWQWSERFAGQAEILRYLCHVAERFDLRKDIQFRTRVTSMVWNEPTRTWAVGTDDGGTVTAKFVVAGVGNLSIAKKPDFPGIEAFGGEVYVTSRWPHEGVDFTGKRVGVIGTGSTAIQAIPEIAKQAAHLNVFQRTPNYAAPLRNREADPDERRDVLTHYRELRQASRESFLGVPYEAPEPSAAEAPAEERQRVYDKYYERGGFQLMVSTYGDILYRKDSNETVAQYIRDKIAERVDDPVVAEMLTPRDHAYGTKRPPFESGYYETFNRPNVTLVDVRKAPIAAITATGLETTEAEYALDVIVLATGFDAFTKALLNMGIVGRDGLTLAEKWVDGPHTYLGIGVAGFPNLFTICGPQSAAVLYNNPLAIEDHVELAADAIRHLLDHGYETIEPTVEAETAWGEHVQNVGAQTLFPETDSWYMGANVPGKPRVFMVYAGGAPAYRKICQDVIDKGYEGFRRERAASSPARRCAA